MTDIIFVRNVSVFVLLFFFWEKGTKRLHHLELSIIAGKRKHAYWDIIPRIVSPRKLCIYVLQAKIISQRLLLIGQKDNAISPAPILASTISDLHDVFEELTNQHPELILFLEKGKSLSKRLKSAQNALARPKLIQLRCVVVDAGRFLLLYLRDEQKLRTLHTVKFSSL